MKEFERQIIAELLEMSELKDIVISGAADNEVVEFSGGWIFDDYQRPYVT